MWRQPRLKLMITTHFPILSTSFTPTRCGYCIEMRRGLTVCKRTADMRGIHQFMETGGKLGHLWMEGFFEVGDPLTNSGGPIQGGKPSC